MRFYMPWQKQKQENKIPNRMIFPERRNVLEDTCFHNVKSPFLSLPNPQGTVRSFMDALQSDKQDEAMGYLSESVASAVDYNEMKGLLGSETGYLYFSEIQPNGIRRVSLLSVEKGYIKMDMISEPNKFGKWKIFRIEKE